MRAPTWSLKSQSAVLTAGALQVDIYVKVWRDAWADLWRGLKSEIVFVWCAKFGVLGDRDCDELV